MGVLAWNRHRWPLVLVAFALLRIAPARGRPPISSDVLRSASRFATWQGIEPDKWGTVWLLKRYVSPDAYFILAPPNTSLPSDAVPFDVPGAEIGRTKASSMFRRLKQTLALRGHALDALDEIIHDVEVNIWDVPSHPRSQWFESLYRDLQARYARDSVPVDCYLTFFDRALDLLQNPEHTAHRYQQELSLRSECPGTTKPKTSFVQARGHLDILRTISLGHAVVFVDVREEQEFDEVHLPGARWLRLRDVSAQTVTQFKKADLVVPYCVKDFRGFEVAKAMKQLGLTRVATLSPNGLRGWIAAGLPVVMSGRSTEAQATAALMRCATEPIRCLESLERDQ